MGKKLFVRSALVLVALLVLIQLVPYGRAHENPPVTKEPAWDAPGTRELAVRACFDCHSNETRWPWYSNVAPVSWLVQHDVDEGREKLNFSTWDVTTGEGEEAAHELREGEMPPYAYVALHDAAHLTRTEAEQLAQGLERTLGAPERKGERLSKEEDDDEDDDRD